VSGLRVWNIEPRLLSLTRPAHQDILVADMPLLLGVEVGLVVAPRYRGETAGADGIAGAVTSRTMGKGELPDGVTL